MRLVSTVVVSLSWVVLGREEDVPCTPPYCSFECLYEDAAVEAAVPDHQDAFATRQALRFHEVHTCDGGRSAIHPLGSMGMPASAVVDCVPAKRGAFLFNGNSSKTHDGQKFEKRYRFGPHEEHEYKRQIRNARWSFVAASEYACDTMRIGESFASGTLPIAPDLLDGNGWCYQSASYLLPRGLLHEARELYEHEVRTGRRDERTYATLAAQGLRYTREFLTTREVMRRVLHRAIPEVSECALPLLAGNRQPCALISSAPSSSSPPGTTGYRESESRGYSFSRDKIHAFEAEALSV
mmetsp:Transcript_11623/g.24450  ORF Transcript_11623/g.24450 Transcript_11623/m.24450 type:complete len:296 (+) Transcript_11623:138-1025(+)